METTSYDPILIVDDSQLIRGFLKNLLETYEFSTAFATNGQEAVSKWEQGSFSMILMDIEMPITDGFEATKVIRQREKDEQRTATPIIGISGASMIGLREQCVKAGMNAFLQKPVTVTEVLDEIYLLI
jgi:CheY-like chemotaxis protein